MDLSFKDIPVNWQDVEVPFIGDLIDLNGRRYFHVEDKKIKVTALTRTSNNHEFNGEVVVTGDFEKSTEHYPYIIVGVQILMEKDDFDIKQDYWARWSLAGTYSSVQSHYVDAFNFREFKSSLASIKTFSVAYVNEFKSFDNIPQTLVQHSYDSLSPLYKLIKMVKRTSEKVCTNLTEDDRDVILRFIDNFAELPQVIKSRIQTHVLDISSDNWLRATNYIVRKLCWAEDIAKMGYKFWDEMVFKGSKSETIFDFALSKTLDYVCDEYSYQQYLLHSDVYILYMNYEDWASNQTEVHTFLRLKNELAAYFCVVNLELIKIKVPPFIVKRFKAGVCVVQNVLEIVNDSRKCLAKCNVELQNFTPPSTALLEIPCLGGSPAGNCRKVKCKPTCSDCHGFIYYGCGSFLCSCGSADVDKFSFRWECQKEFKPLANLSLVHSLKVMNKFNVLVFGSSADVRATFIKALLNFVSYPTFEDARTSRFRVPNSVKMNSDNIEDCKEYTILFEGNVYNFIDSPGFDESRRTDIQIVANTFARYKVDSIHGMVLSLSSFKSPSAADKFFFKEIVSIIPKWTRDGIVFGNFATGSFAALQKLITEMEIDLIFKEANFCIENDIFKFVNSDNFNESQADSSDLWMASVQETGKILSYVSHVKPVHMNTILLTTYAMQSVIVALSSFVTAIILDLHSIANRLDRSVDQLKDSHASVMERLLLNMKNTNRSTKRKSLKMNRPSDSAAMTSNTNCITLIAEELKLKHDNDIDAETEKCMKQFYSLDNEIYSIVSACFMLMRDLRDWAITPFNETFLADLEKSFSVAEENGEEIRVDIAKVKCALLNPNHYSASDMLDGWDYKLFALEEYGPRIEAKVKNSICNVKRGYGTFRK